MTRIAEDISLAVGNTPLVCLRQRSRWTGARILVKLEGANPARSVKCRLAAGLVSDAEQRGVIRPGMYVLEATCGNMGVALATVAAARGYGCALCIPQLMDFDRRVLLASLGARIINTPLHLGMRGAIEEAEVIAGQDERAYYTRQFDNPANPRVHEATTGPEIWEATGGQLDYFVSGVGTGGTVTGVARFLRGKSAGLQVVAVEPDASPVIGQTLAGLALTPGAHRIAGLGCGFIPRTLDLNLLDRAERVTDEEALRTMRELAAQEGIVTGLSGGAAIAVATRIASDPGAKGSTIVAILPDAGMVTHAGSGDALGFGEVASCV